MGIFLDHIGIAVRSLDERTPAYTEALGLAVHGDETIKHMGVRVRMIRLGSTRLELLEPLGEDTPVGRFLEKRGEGIHHICIGVPNLRRALDRMIEKDIKLIDKKPRKGHGGSQVAFVNPKSTGGVLLELKEIKALRALEEHEETRIKRGAIVIVNLQNPKEKFWGILIALDSTGIQILGIELSAIQDLFREVGKGARASMGLNALFFPMARVEKVFLDESVGGVKSLHEHFADMANTTVEELLEKLI
ncbi:methylmalonyl-CoA epimerase [Acidobacteriota bacterium]